MGDGLRPCRLIESGESDDSLCKLPAKNRTRCPSAPSLALREEKSAGEPALHVNEGGDESAGAERHNQLPVPRHQTVRAALRRSLLFSVGAAANRGIGMLANRLRAWVKNQERLELRLKHGGEAASSHRPGLL